MTIRNRLTLLFVGMVGVILLGALSATLIIHGDYTHEQFNDRLRDRADVTGYIFLERDEMRAAAFRDFQRRFMQTLPNEVLQVYDSKMQPTFIEEDERVQVSDGLLARIVDKSPTAIRIGKQVFHAIEDMTLDQSFELTQIMLPVMAMSEDAKEGFAAFNEKRAPQWTGK